MTKKYRCYQIDSFTKEKFSGNPAGVITNADGLTAKDMQKIARELNNSETAFIFSSSDKEAYDVEVRFFTPSKEVPICGHATIAAHYARAIENNLESGRVYQKTGAGILPVDIVKQENDYRIVMTQGEIEFGSILEGANLGQLVSALNICNEDLLENYPVQIVSTGHSKVMVGIKSRALLNKLQPNHDQLTKISSKINCNGYFVFSIEENTGILAHGRMFAPAIGIQEDPVTGNANGPLGAYLVHYNKVNCVGSPFTFQAMQGEAIHRQGIIDVQVNIKNGEPEEVQISGNAVIVFETELSI